MTTTDLFVIGGGPAGYRAAEQAAGKGLNTILAECAAMGGVCLNEGCVPSKTLLHSAKVLDTAKGAATYGVTTGDCTLDHAKVVARKGRVVKMLTGGVVRSVLSAGAQIVEGKARLDGREGDGFRVWVDEELFLAKKILIATGSKPSVPPIPGLDKALADGFAITSSEALSLPELPGELIVIGGGVVGLELASYYNTAGSKVRILEMLPQIAQGFDAAVSEMLLAQLLKKGISFDLECRVTGVGADSVTYEKDGMSHTIHADKVLLAGGRKPFTDGVGLETVDLALRQGGIETDAHMRTGVEGIWAAGDVNGRSMLAHTAYREADVAVADMIGDYDVMSYLTIPSVIYTSPEAASVGLTEAAARNIGMEIKTSSVSMRYSGRFLAENQGGDGLVKLVADAAHNKLVGAHMLGSYSSELISGAAGLIESSLSIPELKRIVFAHPTVGEVIRDALFALD